MFCIKTVLENYITNLLYDPIYLRTWQVLLHSHTLMYVHESYQIQRHHKYVHTSIVQVYAGATNLHKHIPGLIKYSSNDENPKIFSLSIDPD